MNHDVPAGVVTTRVMPYTPEEVFAAWSEPELMTQWWGPAGFTDELIAFDFRVGGRWEHVLRGLDGKGYDNLAIFTEIAAPHRLGFNHYMGFEEVAIPHYVNTTTVTEHPEGTLLSMQMVFESQEVFDTIRHIIHPSNEQNFDKLETTLGKVFGARK